MPRLSELPWLLLIWTARRRIVEGVRVCVSHSAEDADDVFEKAAEALRLIARYAPRMSARMRRDVKRLLFGDVFGGRYLAGLQTCLIGTDYARRALPLELAMMVVHEATHARLARAGFRYVGACRERIERICIAAEIAFAERVPGSGAAIDGTRALQESEWWTPEKGREDAIAALRTRGLPEWIIGILLRLRNRA